MSEWKEVWHVWDGVGTVKGVIKVVDSEGDTEEMHYLDPDLGTYNDDKYHYVAHTTGQKRRRLECKTCHGLGFLSYGQFGPIIDCEHCDMKGYQWEYKDNE